MVTVERNLLFTNPNFSTVVLAQFCNRIKSIMKERTPVPSILLFLILIVITADSKPQPAYKVGERQLSFVVPLQGFFQGFGGSTNVNNINSGSSSSSSAGFGNLLGGIGGLGGVSTRTLFRTVSTVTVATFRTCTLPLMAPGLTVPCGRRRRRDADNIDIAIEPTMVLIVDSTSIVNQEQVSQILGLSQADDYENGNSTGAHAVTTFQPAEETEDPTTTLYPTPTSDISILDDDQSEDGETTTANTPLADFWQDVNRVYGNGKDKESVTNLTNEDDKARLGFGQSTTTVTVSMTGIAYTTVSSPIFTVAYSGCSPNTFPVTSSAC